MLRVGSLRCINIVDEVQYTYESRRSRISGKSDISGFFLKLFATEKYSLRHSIFKAEASPE